MTQLRSREEQIAFRLNDHEKEVIRTKAAALGLDLSNFIRLACMTYKL